VVVPEPERRERRTGLVMRRRSGGSPLKVPFSGSISRVGRLGAGRGVVRALRLVRLVGAVRFGVAERNSDAVPVRSGVDSVVPLLRQLGDAGVGRGELLLE
jgi:hypothetical protein